MRLRVLLAGALALCVAFALTAPATAGHRAKTRVTFNADDAENGDFHGKVISRRLHRCADNRKIKVYKQLGADPKPSNDDLVGTDISELSGDHGVWSLGQPGLSGRFYAKAKRTEFCKPDLSPTVISHH
jgi:hypothetical protein